MRTLGSIKLVSRDGILRTVNWICFRRASSGEVCYSLTAVFLNIHSCCKLHERSCKVLHKIMCSKVCVYLFIVLISVLAFQVHKV